MTPGTTASLISKEAVTTQKNGKLEPMLTIEDLSDLLQVPVATIYGWNSKGTGPQGKKIGRHVRYLQSHVAEWIANAQPSG